MFSAPWHDIVVDCQYRIFLNVGNVQFVSENINDYITFGYFELRNEDDHYYFENDLYQIIEDRLDPEIKELDYRIELITWKY